MILLDYRDKRPIYEQVVEKLQHLIICGALAPDTQMPSVRQLAIDLSINPNTIQRAYRILEQDGYIYSVVGRGNFVSNRSDWESDKQLELIEKLKKLISQALDASIPMGRLEQLIKEIYEEKGDAANDRN